MAKLKILLAATELRGMVTLGGLGEVVTTLAMALKKAGHDTRIVLPYYKLIKFTDKSHKPKRIWQGSIKFGTMPGVEVYEFSITIQKITIPVYLIKGHPWFEKADKPECVYSPDGKPEPYFFFAAALLTWLSDTNFWIPNVIHTHDYHTGLISVYLHNNFKSRLNYQPVATVLTIHNLGFHGLTQKSILKKVGLDPSLGDYSPKLAGMEYYGQINCMKGAIVYSDIVSTVSKTYAEEILQQGYGNGLEGVLQVVYKHNRLKCVLNGINSENWDPARLKQHTAYNTADLSGKKRAKRMLQKKCGLEASEHPVISLRARWCYQKGILLVLHALRKYEFFKWAQLFVVAIRTDNDPEYTGLWYELKGWSISYPNRISFVENQYSIASLQYSGSDMMLMPSLYEPCGLVALEAMRYGTAPIVRRTGGLADIVTSDVGFAFNWPFKEPMLKRDIDEGADLIMQVIEEAIEKYHRPAEWETMVKNAMMKNHDWSTRIPEYETLFNQAVEHADTRQAVH